MTKKLPQRGDTHRIDTLAVRRFITALSADWVVRELSDRDYGVDLKLEYFDNNKPTGVVVFLQVKGTSSVIKPKNNQIIFKNFPTRTLNYCALFPEPFALIHLSINNDEPIYFLWLQKYITHELNDNENTKLEQGTISLKIPVCNNLLLDEGKKKFLKIAQYNLMLRSTLDFLKDKIYWEQEFAQFQNDINNKSICIKRVQKLKSYDALYTDLFHGQNQPVINFDEVIKNIKLIVDFNDDSNRVNALEEFSESINAFAEMLLSKEDVEQFVDEQVGEKPY